MDNDLILYSTADGKTKISLRETDGTVWLTQAQMAELFDCKKQNISLHIKKIFDEGELKQNSVVKHYLTTAADGKEYSTLFYSFFAVTGHRQTITTAIVLWGGLEFIRKRKLIPFLLLTFIAYTIHASAICVLPFYWISQLKVTKAKLSIYMVGIVAAFLLRNQLLVFLQSIVGYKSFQQYEGAQAGVFLFLLIAMAVFTFIFWEQIQNSDNQVLNMSVNALMMACVFSPLLLINPSFMRVVQYYSVFIIFLIPEFRFAFHDNSKALFLRIIAIIMILLLVKQMPSYSFFFM